MKTFDPSLVVEFFELDDKFAKEKIGFSEGGEGDRSLVDRADAENEFAEVDVILFREDAIEYTRPKAVDVEK
jgi:hypothetical protein